MATLLSLIQNWVLMCTCCGRRQHATTEETDEVRCSMTGTPKYVGRITNTQREQMHQGQKETGEAAMVAGAAAFLQVGDSTQRSEPQPLPPLGACPCLHWPWGPRGPGHVGPSTPPHLCCQHPAGKAPIGAPQRQEDRRQPEAPCGPASSDHQGATCHLAAPSTASSLCSLETGNHVK